MRALCIVYIFSALLLAYASTTKKRKRPEEPKGECEQKIRKSESSQTKHLIEQPKVSGQGPKLGDESVKPRKELQKTRIRKPREKLAERPAVSGRKSDEPLNKDDELLTSESVDHTSNNDENTLIRSMKRLEPLGIPTKRSAKLERLTEQPKVPGRALKLGNESIKPLKKLQKTKIRKPREKLTERPAVPGRKSDEPLNKDDELLTSEGVDHTSNNDENTLIQLMKRLKLSDISTEHDTKLGKLTEQPKVSSRTSKLGDERVESRKGPRKIKTIEANGNEPKPIALGLHRKKRKRFSSNKGDGPEKRVQKIELRRKRVNLAERPAILGTKDDEFLNKDNELPIDERSRKSIEKLDYKTIKSLTNDLTAEQWNALLDKWFNAETGELDSKPFSYLLPLEDKKKVELMREADEKNLELLFAALVPREYAPRSQKVVELLEKYLAVFPAMRSEALLTLYTWDFPLSKWHFIPSEEDLEILFRVIKEGFFTREQASNHLPEIVEVGSISKTASESLLNLLMEKKLVYRQDFCSLISYQKACKIGSLKYLEKAKEFCPTVLPDQKCIDEAVKQDH